MSEVYSCSASSSRSISTRSMVAGKVPRHSTQRGLPDPRRRATVTTGLRHQARSPMRNLSRPGRKVQGSGHDAETPRRAHSSRSTINVGERTDAVPPVLWQLEVSHYVEKVRWALDYKARPAHPPLAAPRGSTPGRPSD
jgi:hypothetical protein